MTDDAKDRKKDEFRKTLDSAEKEGLDLAAFGREALKWGQFAADVSRSTRDFLEYIPGDFFSEKEWDAKIAGWEKWRLTANAAKQDLGNKIPQVQTTANSTAISSVTIISSTIIPSLSPAVQKQAWAVLNRFEQILEQSDQIKEIDKEIDRLDIESGKGRESCMSLLKQADVALKMPSGKDSAAPGILLPLRQSIETIIAALLKRRLTQEETKNDYSKVKSIIGQSCRSGVDSIQIESLAKMFVDLTKNLSGGKDKVLSRDRVRELLNEGLLFILTLLRTIDEKKLK